MFGELENFEETKKPIYKHLTFILTTRAGRTDHQRHPRRRCLRSLLRCYFALWGCGRSEAWSPLVSNGGGLRTANQTIPKTQNDQHKNDHHSLLSPGCLSRRQKALFPPHNPKTPPVSKQSIIFHHHNHNQTRI